MEKVVWECGGKISYSASSASMKNVACECGGKISNSGLSYVFVFNRLLGFNEEWLVSVEAR